ncbi:MAG: radical SAM protein [Candidatus Portnoybacteria bacterium]|nr:radical SAM protein [Candidatus Portnoybacteria bacterium]MDD4982465.1 radical SAM protein [Candidatus Portnoybacteria bacterium]
MPNNKCLFVYVGQSDMGFTLAGQRDYGMKREPQIGFAYLSAVLQQQNVDSEILDLTIHPHTKESLNDYIGKTDPIFVGFYAAAAIKDCLIGFLRSTRQKLPNLKIFVGGPDMFEYKDYIAAGADIYCLGEGERTIVELLDWCQGKKEKHQIKGIAYKDGAGKFHQAPAQEFIKNLDELPFPAWDKFDLNNYYDYHVFDMAQPYATIMASRGCPFKCSYCLSNKIWGGVCRRRSPDNVLAEIDYLVQKRGVKYIKFQDDIWALLDINWATEFCQKLINRKYNLKWRCILHPTSFLNNRDKILPLMKKAGCTSVTIGLQSVSARILKNIHRDPGQPAALANLVSQAKKAGLLNSVDFIFGLPGETEETIEENIKFAIKVKPTFCGFYALSILTGSDIWQDQKQGKFQGLPEDIVQKRCKEAARRFYTDPGVFFNTFFSIMKTNPKWILRALGHTKYLLNLSGVLGKKTINVNRQ